MFGFIALLNLLTIAGLTSEITARLLRGVRLKNLIRILLASVATYRYFVLMLYANQFMDPSNLLRPLILYAPPFLGGAFMAVTYFLGWYEEKDED